MAAGTGLAPVDRGGGHIQQFQFQIDPGNIAAGGSEAESVVVPGAQVGDAAILTPGLAIPAGLSISPPRVTANAVTWNIENNSAGAVDLGPGPWYLTLIRGTDMVFAR